MPEDEALALARNAWESINLPNLREHIAATRADATIVVVKGAGHVIEKVVTPSVSEGPGGAGGA